MRWIGCLLAGACARGPASDDAKSPTDTSEPTDLGPAGPFTATCTVSKDNALRARCVVELAEPHPVEVTFSRADGVGPTRTHRSDAALTRHTVPLYFMEAHEAYVWTARIANDPGGAEVHGAFVTGELPAGGDVRLVSTGTPSAPYVGMVSPCIERAFAVIVDTTTGRTVWYQDFAHTLNGFMDGASFTEDRTVLTITDNSVIEADLAGNVLLQLDTGTDLPYVPHHDAFRKDGLTYVLFRETLPGDGGWRLDGFYVVAADRTLLGEWHLGDWYVPSDGAGDLAFPEDASHANAIWVGDDGEALVSLRHLSAVVAVQADPDAANFGDVAWRMSNPASALGTDFSYTVATTGPADFARQHNAHLLPDGRMLLFDNRADLAEPSRAVELSFDVPSGTAVFEREYVLPVHCDFQGGAMATPTGNTLATCAQPRQGYEFDPGGQIVWETEVTCQTGMGTYVPRIVPLDW